RPRIIFGRLREPPQDAQSSLRVFAARKLCQNPEFAAHVREMRARIADGGELRTLQLIGTDGMAAGRFLFRTVSSEGAELTFESHLFAHVSGGRAESFVEVARQVATDDDEDLLTEDSLS
ncbi:hypothetical protein ABT282_32205, partial [Streptomyces sp. NPDC000927]|uniref:hypothetical protein n=1 Tax=Streptomyces sp. NPDC000927 TaxID=3154371 RepID=UPI00332C5212